MPSFKCALKWPSVQRGAAAKAVVSLAKAFFAAAILAVAATEARSVAVREDCAGEFTAVAYERWQYSLQAQPNGSSDGVALCWRLEGCDENALRRAESYAAIFSTHPGLACSLVSYMTLVLAAARRSECFGDGRFTDCD